MTHAMPRKYVNKVLVPVLQTHPDKTGKLFRALYEVCVQDLKERTAVKPEPPHDWKRKVPRSTGYKEVWEMLRPFLTSPTEQIFDYRKAQRYRDEVGNAIRNVKIDLRTETIRKGSPHTLRIIKTQAAYERALKAWEVDVAILGEVKKLG